MKKSQHNEGAPPSFSLTALSSKDKHDFTPPAPGTLSPYALDKLRESFGPALDDVAVQALADTLHITQLEPDETKSRFGFNVPAIEFTYTKPDGSPSGYSRARLLKMPRDADVSVGKYQQPAGTASHLYFPACSFGCMLPVRLQPNEHATKPSKLLKQCLDLGVSAQDAKEIVASAAFIPGFDTEHTLQNLDWQGICKDTLVAIYITEGEKKAAAMCLQGLPTIGIGGVDSWSHQGRGPGEEVKHGLIPDFDQLKLMGRRVIIVFDSDVHINVNVQRAAVALDAALSGHGALVEHKHIPLDIGSPVRSGIVAASKAATVPKLGADDYIIKHGIDAFIDLYSLPGETAKWVSACNEKYVLVESHIYFKESLNTITIPNFTKALTSREQIQVAPALTIHHTKSLPTKLAPFNKLLKKQTLENLGTFILECPGFNHADAFGYDAYMPEFYKTNGTLIYNTYIDDAPKPIASSIPPEKVTFKNAELNKMFDGCPVEFAEFMKHLVEPTENEMVLFFLDAMTYKLNNKMWVAPYVLFFYSATKGTGKSYLLEIIASFFGPSNVYVEGDEDHTSRFNKGAANKLIVCNDEGYVRARDSEAHARQLSRAKRSTTAKTMRVEGKGADAYSVPNSTVRFLNGNTLYNYPVEVGERRCAALACIETKLPGELIKSLEVYRDVAGEPLANLIYWLENRELSPTFYPDHEPPTSQLLRAMLRAQTNVLELFMQDLLQNPELTLTIGAGSRGVDKYKGADWMTAQQLCNIFEYKTSTDHKAHARLVQLLDNQSASFMRLDNLGSGGSLYLVNNRDKYRKYIVDGEMSQEGLDAVRRHLKTAVAETIPTTQDKHAALATGYQLTKSNDARKIEVTAMGRDATQENITRWLTHAIDKKYPLTREIKTLLAQMTNVNKE